MVFSFLVRSDGPDSSSFNTYFREKTITWYRNKIVTEWSCSFEFFFYSRLEVKSYFCLRDFVTDLVLYFCLYLRLTNMWAFFAYAHVHIYTVIYKQLIMNK